MLLVRELRSFRSGGTDQWDAGGSWAGRPAQNALDAFWIFRAGIEGPIDHRTGFLCDIKEVDSLLRIVSKAPIFHSGSTVAVDSISMATALRSLLLFAIREWKGAGKLVRLEVALSPFLSFSITEEDRDLVCVTQSFEFSAAHRLYCADLSDDENRRVFGKCSNPHGHGHNYVFEVAVGGTPDPKTGVVIGLAHLQQVVYECVIHPFDHKNLNVEVADFRTLNPSVENIARVIWTRLEDELMPARLLRIRVWETPKTFAEYCGS